MDAIVVGAVGWLSNFSSSRGRRRVLGPPFSLVALLANQNRDTREIERTSARTEEKT